MQSQLQGAGTAEAHLPSNNLGAGTNDRGLLYLFCEFEVIGTAVGGSSPGKGVNCGTTLRSIIGELFGV